MTVIPLSSVRSYPVSTNVIPTAGRKNSPLGDSVSFKGHAEHEEGEKNSHWFLKLLLVGVAGYVAYRFLKKPVGKFIKELKAENLVESFKKAEKKETFTWSEAEAAMKKIKDENKDSKAGFIFRLSEAKKAECSVTTKEGFALGYKVGDNHVVTSTVACDKLDDKFTKILNGKNYILFS